MTVLKKYSEGNYLLNLLIIAPLIVLELIIGLGISIVPYQLIILFLVFFVILIVFIEPKNGYLLLLLTLPLTGAAVTFGEPVELKNIPMGQHANLSGIDPLVPMTLIVTICFFLQLFLKKRKLHFQILSVDWALLAFLGLVIISILWCPVKISGMFSALKFIFGFLLYFLTVSLIDEKNFLHKVINIWIGLGAIYALIGVGLVGFIGGGRASSTTDSANMFAGLLSLCLLLALGKYYSMDKFGKKSLLILAIALIISAIILSGSRSGFLGLLIGITLFLFLIISDPTRSQRSLKMVLAGILFVGFLILTIFTANIFMSNIYLKEKELGISGAKRLLYLTTPQESQSVKFRFLVWKFTFKLLSDNPRFYLVGAGAGGFTEKSKEYGLRKLIKQDTINHPHNLLLSILVDYGILGILIFLWFSLLFVKTWIYTNTIIPCYNDRVLFYSFICGMIAYLPLMMAEIHLVEKPHWLFLGLGIAMIKHFPQEGDSFDTDKRLS